MCICGKQFLMLIIVVIQTSSNHSLTFFDVLTLVALFPAFRRQVCKAIDDDLVRSMAPLFKDAVMGSTKECYDIQRSSGKSRSPTPHEPDDSPSPFDRDDSTEEDKTP